MSAAGLFLLSTKDDFVNLLDFLDAKTIFTNVVCLGKTLRDAPVAARGGQCPLRKSSSPIQLPLVDYARHVSHREQLSRAVGEGSEGEVASFEGKRTPLPAHAASPSIPSILVTRAAPLQPPMLTRSHTLLSPLPALPLTRAAHVHTCAPHVHTYAHMKL